MGSKLQCGRIPSDKSSLEFLKEFHHQLLEVPDAYLIAQEVDRLFSYVNRYYVQNHAVSTVRDKVLEGWALTDFGAIVDTIIKPCREIMKTNPVLVVNITTQFARLIPTSAMHAVRKVSALEKDAVSILISQGCTEYSRQTGIGPVPDGVCQVIAEFTIGRCCG